MRITSARVVFFGFAVIGGMTSVMIRPPIWHSRRRFGSSGKGVTLLGMRVTIPLGPTFARAVLAGSWAAPISAPGPGGCRQDADSCGGGYATANSYVRIALSSPYLNFADLACFASGVE